MDTPGIADILTTETAAVSAGTAVPGVTAAESVRAEAAVDRSVYRFAFDPASSPAMMAAFAWNRVTPGR